MAKFDVQFLGPEPSIDELKARADHAFREIDPDFIEHGVGYGLVRAQGQTKFAYSVSNAGDALPKYLAALRLALGDLAGQNTSGE